MGRFWCRFQRLWPFQMGWIVFIFVAGWRHNFQKIGKNCEKSAEKFVRTTSYRWQKYFNIIPPQWFRAEMCTYTKKKCSARRYVAQQQVSNCVKVVQRMARNVFVRIKSHAGSKFSRITSWQLYTLRECSWAPILCFFFCGVRWRHSRKSDFKIVFFWSILPHFEEGQHRQCGSIWTQFSTSVRGIAVLNDLWLCRQVAPQDSQMCGGNFPKQNRTQTLCQILYTYHGYYRDNIIKSTRGAQHFVLHPAGIALPSRWCFGF